jgi:solute carrier family 32 (vesicular inhibitory amino acid transporter)
MIGHELNGDPRPASFFHDSPFKTPVIPGSDPKARMRRPIKSFPDIARVAFGQPGAIALSIVLYFELFSCLCIFLVAMGDHLHQLFPSISATAHMTAVALFSMVPIILLRTARLLSYLSMVGTLATIVVVITVFSASLIEGDITAEIAAKEGLEEREGMDHEYHDVWKPGGLPLAFGLIAYCFSGHAIVPSIYSSMGNPPDFERVVHITYLIVLVSCFAVGMGGYYMFGSLVEDQVTLSLKENSSASGSMTILAYLMVITAFSKLVLTMFPLALGMEEIIAPFLSSDMAMEVASGIVKLTLTLLSLLVAVYIPSFSFLCALVGMICTMAVSVIFPAAAHLKLFGSKLSIWTKILDWIFVIVGTVMAVVGTALSVG